MSKGNEWHRERWAARATLEQKVLEGISKRGGSCTIAELRSELRITAQQFGHITRALKRDGFIKTSLTYIDQRAVKMVMLPELYYGTTGERRGRAIQLSLDIERLRQELARKEAELDSMLEKPILKLVMDEVEDT